MSDVIPINDIPKYTRKDFVSDQTVRWCPGCGDYAILASVQKALPAIGIRKEDIVFISGIGCSSRFPYYMDTYGMHTVHGRAPTVATGLKLSNPELSVWLVTGDGDGLSIGGNHMLHICRRNVDVNILLFNNRIYGLTKGQYSPTSPVGKKTKSTPMGSIDRDINPAAVALSAEATFVARTLDADTRHMDPVLQDAAAHKGTSFVEILQNCVIFNDGAFNHVADRSTRADNALYLEHGKPMIFGADNDKGIRLNGFKLEVVDLGEHFSEDDLLIHDETDPTLAYLISKMEHPTHPVPMGVIYRNDAPVYEQEVMTQVHEAVGQRGEPDLHALFHADDTWTVSEEAGAMEVDAEGSSVVSEFDEAYVETVERELSGDEDYFQPSEIHQGLEDDPISNLNFTADVLTVGPDASLKTAIDKMQANNIGSILITDEAGHPIGIFTEFDVLVKVAGQVEDLEGALVAEYMTSNPDSLPAYMPIANALHLMAVHHYRHVPIVDDEGVAVGIISFRDIVRYIETYFDPEARA